MLNLCNIKYSTNSISLYLRAFIPLNNESKHSAVNSVKYDIIVFLSYFGKCTCACVCTGEVNFYVTINIKIIGIKQFIFLGKFQK